MFDLTILKSLYKKLYDARNSLHNYSFFDLDNRVEEVDTKLSEIKEELEEEFNKNSERI